MCVFHSISWITVHQDYHLFNLFSVTLSFTYAFLDLLVAVSSSQPQLFSVGKNNLLLFWLTPTDNSRLQVETIYYFDLHLPLVYACSIKCQQLQAGCCSFLCMHSNQRLKVCVEQEDDIVTKPNLLCIFLIAASSDGIFNVLNEILNENSAFTL